MSKDQANPETKDGESANRLLAGKYKTNEALEDGYLAQQRETQKIIQERRNLEDQVRNLEAINESLQKPRPELDKESLQAAGVDAGNLVEYLEALADDRAAGTVERLLTPLAKAAEASSHLDQDQTRFLQQDPTLQETYNRLATSDPVGAAELVQARFELDQIQNTQQRLEEGDAAVKEAQATSRTSASVPSGSGRQPSGESTDDVDIEKLDKLAQYGRETGDSMPLIRERLLGGKDPIEPWMPGEPPPASLMKKRE